jgi:hypothetical protein
MTTKKRKEIETMVLTVINLLDSSGLNGKKYETLFKSMDDKKFEKWAKSFNGSKFLTVEVLPLKNEPTLDDIKKAADYLKIPLDEYIYYRHDGHSENPIRSQHRVPVGYLFIKKMQQMLIKKNSYTVGISNRSMKTGQVMGDDKSARVSDVETYALTVLGANECLKELLGPRADNMEKKQQLYHNISIYGYSNNSDLTGDINSSQTINTANVYFLGAGILTDLVNFDMILRSSLEKLAK